MKKINLINDPLREGKFLVKNKTIENSLINLFSALSDPSIYFRKKSKLNGSAYLVGISKDIENYLENVNLAKLLQNYNYYLNVNTKLSNFRKRLNMWLKKDRIPLEFIRILSIILFNDLNKQKELLIKIFLKFNYITDRTGSSRFRPPFLLKDVLDPCRIYDIGVSMGDGGLFKYNQQIADGALNGEDLILTKGHMEKLGQLKKKIWGLSDKSIKLSLGKKENKNMYRLDVRNKFYVEYLNFVYDLPIGDKIRQNLREPEILNIKGIKNKNFLKRFLYRGLIDSDGSYSKGASNISFWSESPTLLEEAKGFFTDLNLKFNSKKCEIVIVSESYRDFLELIGSSHKRKLKTILNRISNPPKSYFLKSLNNEKIVKGYFNLEALDFYVNGLGKLFREFREKLGLTRKDYSKKVGIHPETIRPWEYNINGIPFKEICKIIRLNNLNPYEELNRRFSYLNIGKIRLPLKPSKELLDIVKFIIPQKSFNNACVVKRESTKLNKDEIIKLKKRIEDYFKCNVKVNKYSGAFYIYNSYLTLFLDTFFIYEKSWSIMGDEEINIFYNHMNKFLEGDMECKLPFERIKRTILVKKEAETDPKFGCEPDKRSVEELIQYGAINLNKPSGPT